MSSEVSRRLAAATFSSRWARLPVPGMGSITGEAASSAASANCWTVAPCGAAIFSSRVVSMGSRLPPSGFQAGVRAGELA
jgi:hypothetical protein